MMKKKKTPNSFSTKDLLISMLLGWLSRMGENVTFMPNLPANLSE